jgi:hypothetical protein
MKVRFPLLAVAIVAAAGLAVGGSVAAHAATPPTALPAGVNEQGLKYVPNIKIPPTHPQDITKPANTEYSANWAGYAVVANTGQQFNMVGADFNVPSVNCAKSPLGSYGSDFASHWVGIDGYSSATVEQTGASAYCDSTGTPTYYVWYEMYPLNPVAFTGVSPGDAVRATVTYNSTANTYHMNLTDVTTGAAVTSTQACPKGSTCLNSSAEVMTEAPGGGVASGVNLADFAMANFTATRVTDLAGLSGTLSASTDWTSSNIIMEDPNGAALATPSGLYGGRSFNTTWNSAS